MGGLFGGGDFEHGHLGVDESFEVHAHGQRIVGRLGGELLALHRLLTIGARVLHGHLERPVVGHLLDVVVVDIGRQVVAHLLVARRIEHLVVVIGRGVGGLEEDGYRGRGEALRLDGDGAAGHLAFGHGLRVEGTYDHFARCGARLVDAVGVGHVGGLGGQPCGVVLRVAAPGDGGEVLREALAGLLGCGGEGCEVLCGDGGGIEPFGRGNGRVVGCLLVDGHDADEGVAVGYLGSRERIGQHAGRLGYLDGVLLAVVGERHGTGALLQKLVGGGDGRHLGLLLEHGEVGYPLLVGAGLEAGRRHGILDGTGDGYRSSLGGNHFRLQGRRHVRRGRGFLRIVLLATGCRQQQHSEQRCKAPMGPKSLHKQTFLRG